MSSGAAPVTPISTASAARAASSPASSSAGAATTPPTKPAPKKRARAPKIDLDAAIAYHQAEAKKAAKLISEARKQMRNEKRKKARIMKKCADLSIPDFERMLIMKRIGTWDPSTGVSVIPDPDTLAVPDVTTPPPIAVPVAGDEATAPPVAPPAAPAETADAALASDAEAEGEMSP